MKKGEIYEGVIEKVDFPNKGIVMTGGNVRAERNKVVGNYYLGGWSMAFDTTIAMPTLALPNMY